MKKNLDWLEVGEGCCGGYRVGRFELKVGKEAVGVF